MAFDADLLRTCADPSLKPAIIEQFVKEVGSPDPLAVTIRSGNRVILVPPAKTSDEALELVRKHLGQAVVRVGVTQYPAGIGIRDPSELTPTLVDPCENIRMGTALFGKVWRIVLKWYGYPTDEDLRPQMLDDAFHAWRTGQFEEIPVFSAPDPGEPKSAERNRGDVPQHEPESARPPPQETPPGDPNTSGIRVDLSGIDGRTP
ncbi:MULTISPECIES: TraH family protein [unclassified Chelatococcus]|uniref:TraH family protein n=1 Tax=unclassified Chelatococcus TaxID=2638111 RepID=UPI001BCEA2E5|nr:MULTISPECIES: TraH family protein [unclassified Chelatococcus]MBS7701575.1 conjugal transfer protein TraH [Chelatococcus sp. YT9]MBX3557410.1 conjugal transfer protein TraH [Chelatococcus sp.]